MHLSDRDQLTMHLFGEDQLAFDTTGDKATESISDLLPVPDCLPVFYPSPYVSSNMHLSDRDQLTSNTTGDKETESISDLPPLSSFKFSICFETFLLRFFKYYQ